jgi:thiamine pyrophosphate-dependent acetolactate synthase large subunit-like protein
MHGLAAERVEKAGDLVPALGAAIAAGGVRFVIVPTERAENVNRHRDAWQAVASVL